MTICSDCQANNYVQCASCGEAINTDIYDGPNDEPLCQNCFSNEYIVCDNCEMVIANDDAKETPDSGYYCQNCYNDYCTECNNCQQVIWQDDSLTTPHDREYCQACYDRYCTGCDDCGTVIWQNDGNCCESCTFGDEDEEDGGFSARRFQGREEYTRIGSKRRYGVEIETHACYQYSDLFGTVAFEAKEDGSIAGMEFASTILYGDAGLAEIESLCKFGKDHRWVVNGSCGLHIHLDVSNEKTEQLKAIALAYYLTYHAWLKFVCDTRISNSFCAQHRTDMQSLENITSFTKFARLQCRYEWFNFAAYGKYKTFEVRLHQGSIDAEEICNWIRIHAIFMDWAANKTFAEVKEALHGKDTNEQFDFIMELCQTGLVVSV